MTLQYALPGFEIDAAEDSDQLDVFQALAEVAAERDADAAEVAAFRVAWHAADLAEDHLTRAAGADQDDTPRAQVDRGIDGMADVVPCDRPGRHVGHWHLAGAFVWCSGLAGAL